MKHYTKKAPVVMAEKWFEMGDAHQAPIERYTPSYDSSKCTICGIRMDRHGTLKRGASTCLICPGTYIVSNNEGGWGAIPADIFEKEYRPL